MSRDCGRLLNVKHWLFGLVVLCSGLAPRVVGAQAVAGTVVTIDSVTPISGAIVVATAPDGSIVRTLTAVGGRFLLRFPRDGQWHLSVLRIGFTPSPPIVLHLTGQETQRLTLVAQSAPVMLQAISAKGSTECRVRPDTGLLVARVWEEARKAMLSVTLQSQDAVTGEWLEYRRTTNATGRLVTEQDVSVQRHTTQHVFRSPSSETLAREGYVVSDSSGLTFYAPDPEVLLSDSFSASHCFRLSKASASASASRDSVIGVSFEPTRSNQNVRDIAGTVWIDARTSELRSVDFSYTNLPSTRETVASGGQVTFARLPSGVWIVRSWYAQLPVLVAPPRMNAPGTAGTRSGTLIPVVQSVHTTGGEAFRISRGESVLTSWPMPYAHLQLVSNDARVPIAGASVSLRGTNIRLTSDSLGRVRAGPLPSGQYEAHIILALGDSIVSSTLIKTIEVGALASVDSLVLPNAVSLFRTQCQKSATSSAGTAMLRGTVRNSHGQLMANAVVETRFMRTDARLLKAKSVRWREETLQTRTNDRGQWVMCGIPHEVDIAVEVRGDALTAKRRVRVDDARMFLTVDLIVEISRN
ncbi:MAG: carboxypeptidase regulatory-like domain-containing protein [Gemmatimonadaceae bacterium]|nr:carboxypeptidase regulatory-like domain-containing protein [Gemmatimonadaceae bacterium]